MLKDEALANDEAANWSVLLIDDPGDKAQQRKFEAWLAATPLNAQAWAQVQQTHDGLRKLTAKTQQHWPSKAETEKLDKSTVDILHGPLRKRLANKKLAAGFAVAACLLLVVLPTLQLHLAADYITSTAESRTLILKDGSRVYMAPESAIDVAFNETKRDVHLLKGAAYFEVTPNPERPFSVAAGGTQATVLGTAFSVGLTEKGVAVSVAHGRVRVDDQSISPHVSEYLHIGDHLAVTWGRFAQRSNADPTEITPWRAGEFVARDLPLSEVVDVLRGYHSGKIIVTGDLAERRVTGLYRLDNPLATLTDLIASHGGTVRQITPWLLIISE